MLELRKVVVTGGLASGKSSVCSLLRTLGAYVVSADEIGHHLLSPDTNLGKKVINLIGPDIVNNGKIDRGLIAERVFNQPSLLRSLEQLLHPEIGSFINHEYERVKMDGKAKLFVAEIPLFLESNSLNALPYDAIITVLADEEICKRRYQDMGHSPQEFELRMKQQISPSEKAKRADYIIHNNGSMADLKLEVTKIFNTIINL